MFAEFVQGGGTDAVQFAAGEHGLQQVAGVHGPLRFARADDGVQLVDEEHDLPLGALHFFEHRFQPLFELAAELGAGDQRAHIQGDHAFLFEAFGHVAADDALRQAFDDGRFADAWFADQDGIVLGAA